MTLPPLEQLVIWFIVVGALLIAMALGGSVLKRLPLSTSMLYLLVGFALGRFGVGRMGPYARTELLEHLTGRARRSAGTHRRAPSVV